MHPYVKNLFFLPGNETDMANQENGIPDGAAINVAPGTVTVNPDGTVTDPNATPAPAEPTVNPDPVIGIDPVPAPAPAPVLVGDLVKAEDDAKAALQSALDAATAAGQVVTQATAAEASARSLLGAVVNAVNGVGVINPDGTIRVLLPDGNGSYHPITVQGVNAPVPAPQ